MGDRFLMRGVREPWTRLPAPMCASCFVRSPWFGTAWTWEDDDRQSVR